MSLVLFSLHRISREVNISWDQKEPTDLDTRFILPNVNGTKQLKQVTFFFLQRTRDSKYLIGFLLMIQRRTSLTVCDDLDRSVLRFYCGLSGNSSPQKINHLS
jgi:hypothetical protein